MDALKLDMKVKLKLDNPIYKNNFNMSSFSDERNLHEECCPFMTVNCPFVGCKPAKIGIINYLSHWEQSHKDAKEKNGEVVEMCFSNGSLFPNNTTFRINFSEQIFFASFHKRHHKEALNK